MLAVVAILASTLLLKVSARAISPPAQEVFQDGLSTTDYIDLNDLGIVSPARQFDFAQWCKDSKAQFIYDLRNGGADEWVIVMGNEAAG